MEFKIVTQNIIWINTIIKIIKETNEKGIQSTTKYQIVVQDKWGVDTLLGMLGIT